MDLMWSVWINDATGKIVYAVKGTRRDRVWRSRDGGISWKRLTTPKDDWVELASDDTGKNVVAIPQNGRPWVSCTFGNSWTKMERLPVGNWFGPAIKKNGNI